MFCNKFNIDYHYLQVQDVLAFIEVLASITLSVSTKNGYMSAKKAISLLVNTYIILLSHEQAYLEHSPFYLVVSSQPMGIIHKAGSLSLFSADF